MQNVSITKVDNATSPYCQAFCSSRNQKLEDQVKPDVTGLIKFYETREVL